MKKILWLIAVLHTFLMADFQGIDSARLEELMKKGVPVIDIRTPGEWRETGVIPGSKLIMFYDYQGRYDIDRWMRAFKKVVKDKHQPFVLVCRTANRTKTVGRFLSRKLGYDKTMELAGGITFGWIAKGKPVVQPTTERLRP